jgi:hypothetical protein
VSPVTVREMLSVMRSFLAYLKDVRHRPSPTSWRQDRGGVENATSAARGPK